MGAILPTLTLGLDESQVGFIDERGSLQGMTNSLSPHVGLSETMEFPVDQRCQFFQS
jgi:hypothetical protein